MKKAIISLSLALAMCLSLCVPAFAVDTNQTGSEEYEIPNITNVAGNVTDKEPSVPDGYTYFRCTKHNTNFDMIVQNGILVATSIIPIPWVQAVSIAITVSMDLYDKLDGTTVPGKYYDYVYEADDPGIYPYIYWHKIKWYVDVETDDGTERFVQYKSYYEYANLPLRLNK